jgi:hypothetical protein
MKPSPLKFHHNQEYPIARNYFRASKEGFKVTNCAIIEALYKACNATLCPHLPLFILEPIQGVFTVRMANQRFSRNVGLEEFGTVAVSRRFSLRLNDHDPPWNRF